VTQKFNDLYSLIKYFKLKKHYNKITRRSIKSYNKQLDELLIVKQLLASKFKKTKWETFYEDAPNLPIIVNIMRNN
jgi:hypothetical protein